MRIYIYIYIYIYICMKLVLAHPVNVQTPTSIDVQTPFLGTPLAPLNFRSKLGP